MSSYATPNIFAQRMQPVSGMMRRPFGMPTPGVQDGTGALPPWQPPNTLPQQPGMRPMPGNPIPPQFGTGLAPQPPQSMMRFPVASPAPMPPPQQQQPMLDPRAQNIFAQRAMLMRPQGGMQPQRPMMMASQ